MTARIHNKKDIKWFLECKISDYPDYEEFLLSLFYTVFDVDKELFVSIAKQLLENGKCIVDTYSYSIFGSAYINQFITVKPIDDSEYKYEYVLDREKFYSGSYFLQRYDKLLEELYRLVEDNRSKIFLMMDEVKELQNKIKTTSDFLHQHADNLYTK